MAILAVFWAAKTSMRDCVRALSDNVLKVSNDVDSDFNELVNSPLLVCISKNSVDNRPEISDNALNISDTSAKLAFEVCNALTSSVNFDMISSNFCSCVSDEVTEFDVSAFSVCKTSTKSDKSSFALRGCPLCCVTSGDSAVEAGLIPRTGCDCACTDKHKSNANNDANTNPNFRIHVLPHLADSGTIGTVFPASSWVQSLKNWIIPSWTNEWQRTSIAPNV